MWKNLDPVTSNIERDIEAAICWHKNNEMVANPEKFQLMFIGLTDDIKLCIDVIGTMVQTTDSVKLLGVTTDSTLNFNRHVQKICKKASNKVRAFP